MLYLDSAVTTHSVTLFRDYNATNRYYYLPLYPKLTREGGDPLYQLLIYRRDITDNPAFKEGDRLGGGFLTMTVDLSVPEATLKAIKEELSREAGQERLGSQSGAGPLEVPRWQARGHGSRRSPRPSAVPSGGCPGRCTWLWWPVPRRA